MPELPEVETIRKQLHQIVPFEIEKVSYSKVAGSILKKKSRDFSPKGKRIYDIKRKGKLLHFLLEDDQHVLSHLGMSGSWRISKEKITQKHTHIQFHGSSKGRPFFLAYIDPRRFGNMYFYNDERASDYLNGLGVDVGTTDFNHEFLEPIIKKFPHKQIKPFLLEQKYFSGIGNYMASEICALSGIRPERSLAKIKKAEVEKIIKATKKVISGQLEYQGLSFSGGYKDAFGNDGGGLQNLVVFYQKECGLCQKGIIKKIELAGRGTYYCPRCQK